MDFDSPKLGRVSAKEVIGGAALAYAIYYALSAIYCVYFHPLAKYPGPCFAKFSKWPSFYHTLGGSRHIWVWQCHERYGDAFRFRPDGVLFNSPQAYRDIYDAWANVQKSRYYSVFPRRVDEENTWNCIDKAKHARKRRILNSPFSDRAVRSAETYIAPNVDRWIEALLDHPQEQGEKKSEWTAPMNMSECISYLVFDILGELCFGRTFDTKEPGSQPLKHMPKMMINHAKFAHTVGHFPLLDLWLWLKPRGLDSLLHLLTPANVKPFYAFAAASIRQRADEEARHQTAVARDPHAVAPRTDMFHYIFQYRDPETLGYVPGELKGEAELLLIAGSDTTAGALTAALFYLVRHPAALAALTAEVRAAFPTAADVATGAPLAGCRFLRAVIDEALRLNPPVSAELLREVLPGGLRVDGGLLPAGTTVGASLYALHHRADVFPAPFAFKPERWLAGSTPDITPETVARAAAGFHPFSRGARRCPARGLAYVEMSVALAKLLVRADVRLRDGDATGAGGPGLEWGRREPGHFQERDCFVMARDGPVVQLRAREG